MPDRMLAEYTDEDALIEALQRMREKGYRQLEVYMPFPSHEVEDALDRPRSRLGFVIGIIGLGAAGCAYALQWLLEGHLYPLVVGAHPPHFPLAFVLITFEMGVLFAGFASFFGVLRVGRLVRLTDAVQSTPGFESVTVDKFWLEVLASDPEYDLERTQADLRDAGALRVEVPEEAA
ncbi:MAG TPA: DUF3341 domain-containing protein [Kofleriaceae bacterium]|nr:DUF3341 domain-containing protein [Kofleriaceae bacterium]